MLHVASHLPVSAKKNSTRNAEPVPVMENIKLKDIYVFIMVG